MWFVHRTRGSRTRCIVGSGGTRGFAVGYYDACKLLCPEGNHQLVKELEEVDRSKATVRMPMLGKRWTVKTLKEGKWVQVAQGNKPYCYGFFYGLSDHRPGPKVQLLSPIEAVCEERGPFSRPVVQSFRQTGPREGS